MLLCLNESLFIMLCHTCLQHSILLANLMSYADALIQCFYSFIKLYLSDKHSQTLHALKTLRLHGLPTAALHTIYKSVTLVKITYVASPWIDFASQSGKRHIVAFIQRGKRYGLCPADLQTFTELGQAADNKLFRTVLFNRNHDVHSLMPEKSNVSDYHNLRPRYARLLPDRTDQLINRNFINRVLYMSTFIDSVHSALAFCQGF
jgi:hypothetical protein